MWKPSSLQFLTTSKYSGNEPPTLWQHGEQVAIKHVMEMEVLGCMFSSSAHSLTSVRHRLSKATSCFLGLESFLCNRSVSLRARLQEFSKRVQKVATYCSCTWVCSRGVYGELVKWENALLRRIACVRRKSEEDL
eukprot:6504920-Karenia_brevis.AAC.1